MQQKIRTKFKELFNTEGSLYTSPGRINLIGEHTDYNGGFVFMRLLLIRHIVKLNIRCGERFENDCYH